jgi:hypothetical protein
LALRLLAVGLFTLLVSPKSHALENSAFSGFQIDDRGQYLAYGGLRTNLSRPNWFVEPYVQLLAFQQRFYVRSEGQLLPSQLTQVAPTLGLSKSIGKLELQASVGPSFLFSRTDNLVEGPENNVLPQKEKTTKVGYGLNGYAQYWNGSNGFEGLC